MEYDQGQVAISSQLVAGILPEVVRISAEYATYLDNEMPSINTLDPTKDKKKDLWYICITADISNTGKWKREYFSNREKARKRSKELKAIRRSKDLYAAKATPTLIRDAVECDSLAQLYGFKGLRYAFLTWSATFEANKTSLSFCDLLKAYEDDHSENWSKGYLSARWRPFRKKMIPIENECLSLMTLQLQESKKEKRQEIREARELEIQESERKMEEQSQARMNARKAVEEFLDTCSQGSLLELEAKFTSETPYQPSDMEFFHDWIAEREDLGNPYPAKRVERKRRGSEL